MKDKAIETAQRLWRAFLAFTPGQKAVTIAAVLALGIGGYLFSSWASQPSYAPLFTNLAPADASGIIDKLNSSKTPYQLAANGTEILVPQKQVYNLRLTMSSAGLPSAGSTGYSLLDKEGITTSEFKQQIDYQRALEGELGKTIKSINGVSDAAVHLAIPQQTVFDDGTQKPTASVLLTTMPGTQLASAQVQSVINLVSSSVPGLTADQVSVSDSSGHVLSAGGDAGGLTMSSDRTQMTQQYESQLTSSAQAIVDKLVGTGHAQVSTIADLDFNKNTINTHTYTYASGVPPLSEQSSGEVYGPGASASGGVLGANAATPKTSGTPSNGGYSNGSVTKDNAVGEKTQNTTTAPGNVNRVSIAVLLDKNSSQVNQAQIKSLVAAAVGLDPKRGDTISVEVAPFDTTAATAASKAAQKASADLASAKQKAALMSMIKTGGVILLIVIIVVITLIANKRRKGEEPADDLDAFLSTLRDDPGSLPPAPEDIIPAKSRESQQAAQRQQQLSELADNDPAEVARLLRNWLNAKEN